MRIACSKSEWNLQTGQPAILICSTLFLGDALFCRGKKAQNKGEYDEERRSSGVGVCLSWCVCVEPFQRGPGEVHLLVSHPANLSFLSSLWIFSWSKKPWPFWILKEMCLMVLADLMSCSKSARPHYALVEVAFEARCLSFGFPLLHFLRSPVRSSSGAAPEL